MSYPSQSLNVIHTSYRRFFFKYYYLEIRTLVYLVSVTRSGIRRAQHFVLKTVPFRDL